MVSGPWSVVRSQESGVRSQEEGTLRAGAVGACSMWSGRAGVVRLGFVLRGGRSCWRVYMDAGARLGGRLALLLTLPSRWPRPHNGAQM